MRYGRLARNFRVVPVTLTQHPPSMTPSSPSRESAGWPCARLADHMDEWLDHALPDSDAAAIAAHLTRCPPCAGRVAHERRFRDALERCGRLAPAPDALIARVRGAFRRGSPPDAVS